MVSRGRYCEAADLAAALRRVADMGARTVIFDVEPLVAFWDTDPRVLREGIDTVLARAADNDTVEVIAFATNSLRRGHVDQVSDQVRVIYVTAASKPMRLAPYRGLPAPGVVVGDQVATDGVLARRLGYGFVHYRPRLDDIPMGPRLMHYLGRPLRRLLFRV